MTDQFPTNLELLASKLRAPFPPDEVKWRPQGKVTSNGSFRMVCYIDARCVMDRLDEACGMGNWRSSTRMEGKGWIARIGIRVVRSDCSVDWVEHEDGSDESDIEAFKGGISDALKRAAVRFGVFAYGYGAPTFYAPSKKGNDGKDYAPIGWHPDPSKLPAEFRPTAQQAPAQQQRAPETKPAQEAQRPANARPGDPQPVAQVVADMGVLTPKAAEAMKKLQMALRLVPLEHGVVKKIFERQVDVKTGKMVGKRYLEFAEAAIRTNDERAKSGGWGYLRWVCDRPDLRAWNGDSWDPKDIEKAREWRDWINKNDLYNYCTFVDNWAAKVREQLADDGSGPTDAELAELKGD